MQLEDQGRFADRADRMKRRILIVDDEESILEILGHHLSESYECVLTSSAVEALSLLENEHFDLLMTDLKMPEMHGLEVMQRARARDRDLAVLVITALLDVKNAIEALRAGAADYLLKPFNLSEISLAVEKALDRRRLLMENREYQSLLEERVQAAVADLELTNRELRDTKEYLENLLRSSVDAIITADANSAKLTFVNEAASLMLGYREEEFLGKSVAKFLLGGKDEIRYITRLLNTKVPLKSYETELVHRDGRHVPANISVSCVYGADGQLVSLLGICKDITEQKRLEKELKELSIKDSLTGLYNQRYFFDRLQAELERSQRQKHPLSLLLFDLDQFKSYNDAHGHLEGDRVLHAVGEVVLECTREHVDIGFRYGGDEFTVILPEADESVAHTIAERIRKSFEQRHFDQLTLSIGLISYEMGTSLRSFVRFADAVMYDAKRAGGNRVKIYRLENLESQSPQDQQPEQEAAK